MAKFLDYTSRDYESYRQDMIAKIKEKMPEWTDTSESDAGIVILEALAYGLESLSYYNDRIANEAFLDTASQRRSVIKHCRNIGYELAWQTSALYKQVFELEPQLTDTVIPKGFQVSTENTATEDAVIFETLADLIIPAGKTGLEKDVNGNYIYTVDIEHSQQITNELLGTVTKSDDFLEFKLKYGPALKESISVYVLEGVNKRKWNPVDDFIGSAQDSEDFQRFINEYDETIIQFGNGISGRKPPVASSVYADYKIGGGIVGNVGASTIKVSLTTIPGLKSTFNPSGAYTKGQDKESIASAKINAPSSLRRLDRYVSLPDYEDGLKQDIEGIAQVKAVAETGVIGIYIVLTTGEPISPTLQTTIENTINDKKIIFDTFAVHDATLVPVDVQVDLTIYDNYDPEVIRYGATNIINEMFNISNVVFGEDFKIGELYKNLFGLEGVRNVRVITPTADVVIGDTSLMKAGTISVLVGGN